MPELPEVETVKNELLPHVIGRCIKGVTLLWEGMVKEPSAEEFISRVSGQEITAIDRRGKYLFFKLGSGETMIVHLKMTGSLIVQAEAEELPQYTRAVIHLDNDTKIAFRDLRKFGVLKVVKDPGSVIEKLGIEPFDEEFTPEFLSGLLGKRKAPVKAVLTDQSLIAGIGNMYADEALFAVKVHPFRSSDSLTKQEIEGLHRAIREILLAAIENKGASIDTYIRPGGSKGTAHFQFNVAHRYKEACRICCTPIERVRVRNRGSYFCPKCQPEITARG